MNGQHFRAFLWLRWRLRVNQMRRAGAVNAVILAVLAILAVALAIVLFVAFFLIGLFPLAKIFPAALMYVWDGLVVAFLFFWVIGLVTDLQRAESLSLQKFLHLPVSLTSVFLINYLSSLFSLTLLVFLPAMLGLWFGLVFSRGPAQLLVLPLLAAFLLMVTALTYQFQGWLAALMSNPRRRNTVIVLLTMSFILLCQLPNLLNILHPWEDKEGKEFTAELLREHQELNRSLADQKITRQEYQRRLEQLQIDQKLRIEERERQTFQQLGQVARVVNMAVPPGWLPWGAGSVAAGEFWPALVGTLGLTLIGAASLWRSYRTTVRLYRGEFSGGKKRPTAVGAPVGAGSPPRLLEAKLPWLSEQTSAVALASFRGFVRAPEAKMMLLTPVLMLVIFGGMLLSRTMTVPVVVRPLQGFGVVAMVLLSMVQFVGNQFGFDRNGFRVFVLCGAPRKDVLLGKNLAAAPFALGMSVVMVALGQVIFPARLQHFLAFLPQAVVMYLLFCLVANALSILAPVHVPAGSFRGSNVKGITILLHVAFVFVFPLALSPALLPLGVEFALMGQGWAERVPICLLVSLVECVAVVYLYRLVLGWEGRWLQAREQRILNIVTSKTE